MGTKINPELTTLAESLGAMGYHTIAEVTGPLLELTGLNRGFDEYHYRSEKNYLKDEWGKMLIEKLSSNAWPKPFFLMLHLWELHMERQMLPGYDDERYGKIRYDRALSSLDSQLGPIFERAKDDIIILTGDHGETFPETRWQEICSFLRWDLTKNMRKITRKLGKEWPRHKKLWGHGVGLGLVDELIRIPLVISVKGLVPEGMEIQQMVRQVDILPTVLDLVGGLEKWQPKGHGVSLKPLLDGGEVEVPPVYLESAHSPRFEEIEGVRGGFTLGIQTPRYKMLFEEGSEDKYQLFDINDPTEPLSAAEPKFKKIAETLKSDFNKLIKDENKGQNILKLDPEEGDLMEARLKDLGYL